MKSKPFRKIILTTAAGFAVLALTPRAYAQAAKAPEIYFYPTSGWNVSKQQDTCSIYSQFNNGFVVEFSGSQEWVDALKVNFRQNVFEAGKDYDVTITVPGVAVETIKGKALNEQGLGLSLKRYKELYKNITKSGVLDFSVEGNNFRFYLTGFAGQYAKFERCMSASSEQEVRQALADKPAPKPAAQKAEEKVALIEENVPEPLVATARTNAASTLYGAEPEIEEAVEMEAKAKAALSGGQPEKRQRMSEKLSEEILNNPEMAAISDEKLLAPPEITAAPTPESKMKPLEMPPKLDEIALIDDTDLKIEPIEVQTPEDDKSDEDKVPSAQEQEELLKKAAQKQLEMKADDAPVVAAIQQTAEPESFIPMPGEEPVAEAAPAAAPEPVAPNKDAAPSEIEAAYFPEPLAAEPVPVEKMVEVKKIKTPETIINKKSMSAEADFTDLEPAAADDLAPFRDSGDQALLAKLDQLQNRLSLLESENKALNDDLQKSLRAGEKERLQISSENWNLESATMKYNEAERQINRLGQQLQSERAKCKVEKKELEAMLFDPQLTQENQLARLASLEEQLEKARKDNEAQRLKFEEQMRLMKEQNR